MQIVKKEELELMKMLKRSSFAYKFNVSLSKYKDVKTVNDMLSFYTRKIDAFRDASTMLANLRKIHKMYPNRMSWDQFKKWVIKGVYLTMKKKAERG